MTTFNESATARVYEMVHTALAAACLDLHAASPDDLPGNLVVLAFAAGETIDRLCAQDARAFLSEQDHIWFDDEREIND